MVKLKKVFNCSCGRQHDAIVDEYLIESNAILRVPDYVKKSGANKVFLLADMNTYEAAGQRVYTALKEKGISISQYVFTNTIIEPDEYAVGEAIMHYDSTCDIVIAVGSGVMNDIGKILANNVCHPYIIVATAPSMDGYASATSSMVMDGLKVSLSSKCANVIIGDLDVLKNAPTKMILSGLGDMLAKYISICEWRIAHLITGEYYCENIAKIVRESLKKCIDNASGILNGDEAAVKAVFGGLVAAGMAMNYAGLSRPASGVEHYFSHVWDMRGLEFGTPVELHGIQCAVGTLYAAKIYDKIKKLTPDKEKALRYARNFNYTKYRQKLIEFLGKGADTMIEIETREQKYDIQKHKERLESIVNHWDEILAIIEEEIPTVEFLEELYNTIGLPKTAEEIGISNDIVPMTFYATKDIRDKYVLSRLCWDLGIIEEVV